MARQRVPFRIAFRTESDFVNAYLAPPDSMDGALLLASVRARGLSETPGAFEAYQALMQRIVESASLLATGEALPGTWDVLAAPESERTGEA